MKVLLILCALVLTEEIADNLSDIFDGESFRKEKVLALKGTGSFLLLYDGQVDLKKRNGLLIRSSEITH